jgi:carbonic anhydrase
MTVAGESQLPDPAAEIEALLQGNRDWADGRIQADPQSFQRLAAVHEPPYLFIGCCDARNPLDQITGRGPGSLFFHRNVGNQVHPDDPAIGASFEFSLGTLGVRHLIVCGHTRCGGMQTALGQDPGGDLGRWTAPLRALAAEKRAEIPHEASFEARTDALARLNVIRQLEHALAHSAVQARLAHPEPPLHLHGWMFHLETGLVERLPLPWERWREEGRLPHLLP